MREQDSVSERDFRASCILVMNELAKRRVKGKFYKVLGYSPSIVSLWRAGKKKISLEQEKAFFEAAVNVLTDYEQKQSTLIQEKSQLYDKFQALTSN